MRTQQQYSHYGGSYFSRPKPIARASFSGESPSLRMTPAVPAN